MLHELVISDTAHQNLNKLLSRTTLRGPKVCRIVEAKKVTGFTTLRLVKIESTEVSIQKVFEHLLNEIIL